MQKLSLATLSAAFSAVFALSPTVCPSQATKPAAPVAAPAPQVHEAEVKPQPEVPTPAHELNAADLEAFFDGIFPLQLERNDIAGVSVLVMKDGKVLLQKGYGYADVKAIFETVQFPLLAPRA